MKKQYLIFTLLFSFIASISLAQKRYIDPIYSDADIEVTSDVKYATNIDFPYPSCVLFVALCLLGFCFDIDASHKVR